MSESLRDPLRLKLMLNAIDQLLTADADSPFDSFNEKDLRHFGGVKLLEIVGEAAYKLTNEFKYAHPETLWKLITCMRYVPVHDYYQIKRKDV